VGDYRIVYAVNDGELIVLIVDAVTGERSTENADRACRSAWRG
jgi:mRNA-degrading endonuclease RelE of RelBE toxin-antitoxin system